MEPSASPQFCPTPLSSVRALNTHDILEQIVCCDALSRRDIINCAVVCRFWSEFALNNIWSKSSLVNLLRMFPCGEHIDPDTKKVEWSVGDNLITVAHWDRFFFYSKRVMTLWARSDATFRIQVSDSLLSEMSFSRPGIELFPKLKKLDWSVTRSDSRTWIKFGRVFLNANLSDLTISSNEDETSIAHFVSEIPARAPSLSSLRIRIETFEWYSPSQWFTLGLTRVLYSLPNLIELTSQCDSTAPESVRAIAKLPKLEALSLGLLSNENFVGSVDVDKPFPSLTSLKIFSGTVHGINQFLDVISNKQGITALTVSIIDYNEIALEKFVLNLQSACPALERLTLSRDKSGRPGFSNISEEMIPSLPRTMLELLKRLQRLKKLDVTYYRPSEMTDDDFVELVASMPNLTELYFTCIPTTVRHPALTLRVLHRLSKLYQRKARSRRLTRLQLHVDASTWPNKTVDTLLCSTDVCELDDLKSLTTSASPIGSVDDTALYLSQMLSPSTRIDLDAFNSNFPPGLVRSALASPGLASPGLVPVGSEDQVAKEMDDRNRKWLEVFERVEGFRRAQIVIERRKSRRSLAN